MNKLQEALALTNKQNPKISHTVSHSKIDQLKTLTFDTSPIHVAQNLLSVRENPKDYIKQHKLEFKFRQTQCWQPSQKESEINLLDIFQQSVLNDTTNAVSMIESSKMEEPQISQSQQSIRRKIMFKSRLSKQPSDSSIWKKPLKQITKILLQLKQSSKNQFYIVIKYDDASNQLETKIPNEQNILEWNCQIKFEITDDQNLYLIVVQQDGKTQQNVLQQAINIQQIDKLFNQEVELKYLKQTLNALLSVEFK